MPRVYIVADRLKVPYPLLSLVVDEIRAIIASEMSDEGNALTSKDVTIRCKYRGNLDRGELDLEVTIIAGEYPERAQNLDDRRERIQKRVRALLPPDVHGDVYIVLGRDSYGQF